MRLPGGWRGRGETLHVACGCDAEYLPHCVTLLQSLTTTQRRSLHVHILPATDLTAGTRRTIASWLESSGVALTFHQIDETRLEGLPVKFSPVTWYRVLLPELLPDVERVLYLDCDVIVVDRLDPLWRLDLSRHCVAAVTNPPITLEWAEQHAHALGLSGVDDYFNAGVMLLNLAELRSGGWIDRIIEYAVTHADRERATLVDENSPRDVFVYTLQHPERLLFPDQDSFNAVLRGRRVKLHPRWNYQQLFDRSEVRTAALTDQIIAEARADPAIRHFEGPGHSKPWHPDAEPDAKALYWAHRERTPWPGL